MWIHQPQWNYEVSMELDLQEKISAWNCDFKMCDIEKFYNLFQNYGIMVFFLL